MNGDTMTIKGKDFKKAVAFIKDFLQKMPEDADCAQLRDSLNLSLLYMKKYFRTVWLRTQEHNDSNNLSSSLPRGVSDTGTHQDIPDRFSWRWAVVDHTKILRGSLPADGGKNAARVPLILQAAKEGDRELIEQLIEKEPSCVNDMDEFGRTAGMYAVHFGAQECLEVLLQGEIDTSHQAHDGSTMLHVAVHDGNYDAVELLLKHQEVATIQDSQGRAPIHWATMLPDTQCLQLLLKCNINVNVRDRDGLTPAMWACHMDNQRHFELLTSSHSNKIAENDGIERDAMGRTWIHWAVRRTEPLKCLKNLLTAETAAIKDNEGRSVIHISAQLGALEACRAIVSNVGTNCLQDVDNHNRTCLHMAAMAAHGEVLNLLLEQGADISLRDSSNLTAWDYSCNKNLHYCMMVIRSFHKQLENKEPVQRQSHKNTAEQEKLEDIEENNNCAILPLQNKSVTPTPPTIDKHGVPSPPNQPKPPKSLFQNIPVPNRARSPRPLSPKVPLSPPPVEAFEGSEPQDEQDTEESSQASPLRERGGRVTDVEDNSQHTELDSSSPTKESGDIVQSADDGIISSDMQPSHQTVEIEDNPQDDEAPIPDGGFQNRQRSVSLGSDDISEQSINIGMDVSDIEGEGQSNADSTVEERPVEPLSPKQRPPPHLAKSPALLPGRSSSPATAVPPRPASPGPATLYQPAGQPQMHNAMQNNHGDNQMTSSSPVPKMHQDRRTSLPPPQPVAASPRRLLPLGGGGLVSQSNGEDMKGGKGKKKKKKRSASLGTGSGDNTLQPISTLKSPTAPLQPVLGGSLLRPPSPSNNLQPPLSSSRPHSPRSDTSSSPRPPNSRGSSPQVSPSSRNTLPQAQSNAWEVSWGPKQPKVPATPITPRDQRSGSPLPSAPSPQPAHPGDGNGQRLPKEGKEQQNGKKGGLGLQKGMLKPQPLHPQGRPLAPMRPGGQGSFPNQQRSLAPRISQSSPRQHASQSYTQPLNPAPPRGRGRPGGYSL